MRSVFDTNVLISALLFEHGKPGQAFRIALRRGHVLCSAPVLEELSDVLGRRKFDRYVTPAEREEFLEAFIARATFVEPAEAISACRDPKDNKLLELAAAGGAQYLVTGDDDLLALHPFREIAILSPGQFLDVTRTDP